MGRSGLRAVTNPSEMFLSDRKLGQAAEDGSPAAACVTVVMQGSRPMLLEVQVGWGAGGLPSDGSV